MSVWCPCATSAFSICNHVAKGWLSIKVTTAVLHWGSIARKLTHNESNSKAKFEPKLCTQARFRHVTNQKMTLHIFGWDAPGNQQNHGMKHVFQVSTYLWPQCGRWDFFCTNQSLFQQNAFGQPSYWMFYKPNLQTWRMPNFMFRKHPGRCGKCIVLSAANLLAPSAAFYSLWSPPCERLRYGCRSACKDLASACKDLASA